MEEELVGDAKRPTAKDGKALRRVRNVGALEQDLRERWRHTMRETERKRKRGGLCMCACVSARKREREREREREIFRALVTCQV